MLRTTTFSLILLVSVGVILPFANSAHGLRQNVQVGLHRNHRYHSRAWWRRYRARVRAKRAAEMAHRNALLALPQNVSLNNLIETSKSVMSSSTEMSSYPVVSSNAAGPAPQVDAVTPAAPQPLTSSNVSLPGQMNLAVVALSRPNPAFLTAREESKMLAGVNISEFRRIVIDKMLAAGGWVTNDFVRDVNGSRVFVVTAHTPRDNKTVEKVWTFYFTEAGGRVYSLTVDSPVESADQMSDEAERLINSLHNQNNR